MDDDREISVDSPTYPYERVADFPKMEMAAEIPLIICRYLMDLPMPGYTPKDDNRFPRCRLMKRLWYDDPDPLGKALPTPEEKLSMLFDGNHPTLNTKEEQTQHPQGYRLYPLQWWMQSQIEAQTSLKVYMGRETPLDDFRVEIGVIFDIYCNANLETGMGVAGLSKAYSMEKDIVDALHGVNFAGVGVMNYSRHTHGDAGSQNFYDESGTNVGRRLVMSLTYMAGGGGTVESWGVMR